MTITGGQPPELDVLRLLARRTYASAQDVARTCNLGPSAARAYLVVLESMRLVLSFQDPDSRAPRRVYALTGEGRRKAGGSDAMSASNT